MNIKRLVIVGAILLFSINLFATSTNTETITPTITQTVTQTVTQTPTSTVTITETVGLTLLLTGQAPTAINVSDMFVTNISIDINSSQSLDRFIITLYDYGTDLPVQTLVDLTTSVASGASILGFDDTTMGSVVSGTYYYEVRVYSGMFTVVENTKSLGAITITNIPTSTPTYTPSSTYTSTDTPGTITETNTPEPPTSTFTPTDTVDPSTLCQIDDMEDGNEYGVFLGMGGLWTTYDDLINTGSSYADPMTDGWASYHGLASAPFYMTDHSAYPRAGSTYAARLTGYVTTHMSPIPPAESCMPPFDCTTPDSSHMVGKLGFQYGYIGMRANLTAGSTHPNCFEVDASSCVGVRFYVRGDGGQYSVKLPFYSVDSCNGESSETGLNEFKNTITASAGWTLMEIPFSAFTQDAGWGIASDINTVIQHLKSIEFQADGQVTHANPMEGGNGVDLWIDDLAFYGCSSCPAMVPTSTPIVGSLTNTPTITPTITRTNTPTITPTIMATLVCGLWVDVDGSGQESINLNTLLNSSSPSLFVDSFNNQHIAWFDNSGGTGFNEIYYLKWNGVEWVDADGIGRESIKVSNETYSSFYPSLYVDNSGNPHIAWHQISLTSGTVVCYLKWNGSEWVDVDGVGQESIYVTSTNSADLPKLFVDGSGNPHITYDDDITGNFEVYYLKWNGSEWVDVDGVGLESSNISNTSGSSNGGSFGFDIFGNLHFVWSDSTSGNSEIYYQTWNGSVWVDSDGTGLESINISNTSENSISPSLSMSTNKLGVAWEEGVAGLTDIYYLQLTGGLWTDADGTGQESVRVSDGLDDAVNPSLYIDVNDNPAVVWTYDTFGDQEIYFVQWSGSEWVDADGVGQESANISNNTETSFDPKLFIDGTGVCNVAWRDYSLEKNEIFFLKALSCSSATTSTNTPTNTVTITATQTIGIPSPTYTPGPFDGDGNAGSGGLGAGDDKGVCIAYDDAGRMMVAGYTWSDACTCYVMVIWRYALDGTIDYSFGGGKGYIECPGSYTFLFEANIDIQIDINGKFIVTTYVEGCGGTCIDAVTYRYNADWSIDISYGGTGYVQTPNVCENITQVTECQVIIDEFGNCFIIGSRWNGSSYDACVYKYTMTGTLDITFGGGTGYCTISDPVNANWFEKINSITIGVDGKLYMTGTSTSDNPGCTGECTIMVVYRFNIDGTIDTTFGTGGVLEYSNPGIDHINCVPVQIEVTLDGKLLVLGNRWDTTCGCYISVVWKFNIDGTIDTSFGTDGYVEYTVPNGCVSTEIIIDINGNIIVTGYQNNGTDTDLFVCKYLPDGTPDPSFGTGGCYIYDSGGDDSSLSVFIDIYFNIIITGTIEVGGETQMLIQQCPIILPSPTPVATAYTFDGEGCVRHDNAGGGNGDDMGKKIIKTADGKLFVAGISWDTSCSCYAMIIWKYNIDGTIDYTFGDGKGHVKCPGLSVSYIWDTEIDITVDINGKILVTGYINGCNNTCKDMVIYRFNADGTLDTTFNDCGYVVHHDPNNNDDKGSSIITDATGRVYVAGTTWDTTCGCYVMAVCRYTVSGILDTSFGTGGCVKYDNGSGMTTSVSIKIDINDKIVMTGYGDSADAGCSGDCKEIIVVRLNVDGTFDPTFGTDGVFKYINTALSQTHCIATSMEVLLDGRIVVTGYVDDGSGCTLSCRQMITIVISITGTLDITFNGTGYVTHTGGCDGAAGTGVYLDDCGRIVIGGTGSLSGDINALMWRYDITGALDTSFNFTGYDMYAKTGGYEDYLNSIVVNGCAEVIGTGYSRTDGVCSLSCKDMWMWRFYDGSTPTNTPVVTATPTSTITSTHTISPTATATITLTASASSTDTITETITETVTETITETITETVTKTITETITETITPTNVNTLADTLTTTPTVTATSTLTSTPTTTPTVTSTGTMVIASPTSTQTPICNPIFTVDLIFYKDGSKEVLFEITSTTLLASPPVLDVYPHGMSDSKPMMSFVSLPVPGEPYMYHVIYPKVTGYGDVDKAVVRGMDLCGNNSMSDGEFNKLAGSNKSVQVFKNVIQPDLGERTTFIIKGDDDNDDDVRVRVFTKNGALVITLHDGDVGNDHYLTLYWDGKNDSGVTVASGIYIVVIESEGRVYKEKVAIIR